MVFVSFYIFSYVFGQSIVEIFAIFNLLIIAVNDLNYLMLYDVKPLGEVVSSTYFLNFLISLFN